MAPGSLIRSAKMGGGTLVASGTSMAAPHVAGAVALLLELHPEWTPADVKAALVGSARSIESDVMGQGGGRIDVYGAAKGGGAIWPAVVTFGRHGRAGAWTSTRTVRVINRSATAQTFQAGFSTPANVTVTAEPPSFTLGAGGSRDVVLNAAITAEAEEALATLAHGGRITFTSNDIAMQVPWVAVDAARLVLTHELRSSILWSCDRGPGMSPTAPGFSHELLVPNSRCDLVAYALADEGGGATLVSKDVRIHDDVELAFTIADAMHEFRVAGVDQNGAPIGREFTEKAPYFAMYNLEFPPESLFRSLSFSTASAEPLHMSAFDDGFTVTASEVSFDFPSHRIYAIHHRPVRGVRGPMTVSTLASDLRHARVNVLPQRDGTTLNAMIVYMLEGFTISMGMNPSAAVQHGWSGDLYLTEEPAAHIWAGAALHTARAADQVWLDFATPTFRAIDGRIVLSADIHPSPAAYSVEEGGLISLGETPASPASFVDTRGTAFAVFPGFAGPVRESLVGLHSDLQYELRDDGGTLLREGTNGGNIIDDFGRTGAYRATFRTRNGVELALRFDTSLPDHNPPSLSSLRVVGADARVVSRVAAGEAATLAFSVVDITRDTNGVARHSNQLRTPRVSWRIGSSAWQQLPLTVAFEDVGDPEQLGHFETGVHYRSDLSAITTSTAGNLELRVELEDTSGNTSTSVMKDVLKVGQRRRAVR